MPQLRRKLAKQEYIILDDNDRKIIPFGLSKQIKGFTPKVLESAKVYVEETTYPTIPGLAKKLHVSERTLLYWYNKVEEFVAVVDSLSAKNKDYLMRLGVKKKLDSGLVKFLLSSVHGLREKTEVMTENKSIVLNITMSDGSKTKADLV